MTKKKTALEEFLDAPANMHAREQVLMHRLFLDVKTAAAQRGYYLNTYFDDVDHDGFDVIFDDQDYIKKIQVKSVQRGGSTGAWSIHKRILRPLYSLVDKLGFESSPEGEGSEGGVVLIEFSEDNGEIRCDYYYTDVFVLTLFYCDFIVRTNGNSQDAVEATYPDWRRGSGSERIMIPKAAFLKAKNPAALLSLMGLHSASQSMWKHTLIRLAGIYFGLDEVRPRPSSCTTINHLWGQLSDLCNETKLDIGKPLQCPTPIEPST